MANTRQSKKRIIQSDKRHRNNIHHISKMKNCIKKVKDNIKSGNLELSQSLFKNLDSLLSKYSTKGIIHKNKASRLKSRISLKIKNLYLTKNKK